MAELLYIKASPGKERSFSIAAANAFVEAYRERHPEDRVIELDLFETVLPEFDGHVVQAKYAVMGGLSHTDEEKAAWADVEKVVSRFKSADKYAFAVPMWNFGIPYRLKHYLDIIVQPTYTFRFSPDTGYTGLVTGKPVFVAYARGGAYGPGTGAEPYDFQSSYLEHILRFIGLTDIRPLLVEPTVRQGPAAAAVTRERAIMEARQMADRF